MINARQHLKMAETIVIKVGTSTITYQNGRLNLNVLEKLAYIISDLKNQGKRVVLVTSGAIGVGNSKLGFKQKTGHVSDKQAAAAIGQCELMHIYSKLFSEYGYVVGQILLTREEIEVEQRRINVVNTFNTLLDYGTVPIVNANDSISTEEIEFGDNDTLSAIVAKIIGANLLIILSDIEGMYDKDPSKEQNAKLISVVEVIDRAIEEAAGGSGSSLGTGGMATKIAAAQIATQCSADVVIANGADPHVIRKILDGEEVGTLFIAEGKEKNNSL